MASETDAICSVPLGSDPLDCVPLGSTGADRIAVQAQRIRDHYRLSAREAEVMELLARGNSVARIAEMLVVSENTIRTHSKRIYSKLDIHKRQELIELVESFDPEGHLATRAQS